MVGLRMNFSEYEKPFASGGSLKNLLLRECMFFVQIQQRTVFPCNGEPFSDKRISISEDCIYILTLECPRCPCIPSAAFSTVEALKVEFSQL
jgi:hypothetical protein